MKLYHYAASKYENLATRLERGEVTAEEVEIDNGKKMDLDYLPYYRHISFFKEPLPLNAVAAVFKGNHPFWKPGTHVYRHEVEVDDILPAWYKLAESVEMMVHFYDPKLDDLTGDQWRAFEKKELIKLGYLGNQPSALKKAILKNQGKTLEAYLALPSRPNFNDIKMKYAAAVPHLMVYPEKGIVKVKKVVKELILDKVSIYHKW